MAKSDAYWEKRIASKTWKTYNSLEEKNRDLLEFYLDASKAVKEELYTLAEKHSKEGTLSLSEMHKQNRLTRLNEKYEQIAKELGEKVESFAVENMETGFQEVYKNVAVGMGDIEFAMPNKKLMEKLLNEPWRGDDFSGRLWKNQKKLAAGLNEILLVGLQQGKTVTEIAVSLHNFMGQGFNQCHRLVRTESMHYLNSATLQRYKDAGVEFVKILAAVDERTCDDCGSENGNIYPIDKVPPLPFHANCRCTIIPVVDEDEIAEYLKDNDIDQTEFEADLGGSINEVLTGITRQKKMFVQTLKKVEDENVKTLLQQALDRTTIKRASQKRSKYSAKEKVVYLAKGANSSTIAHELFHEIDDTYSLVREGLLKKSVQSDYRRLQNLSKGYGKPIPEMLYSKYPEAFIEDEKRTVNVKYRAVSDILNGMSKGEIELGFIHDVDYWNKPGKVEAETFAQFGRSLFESDSDVLSMMKDIFPDSYKEVMRTLERMIK